MKKSEKEVMVFGYEYNGKFITIKSVKENDCGSTFSFIDDRLFRAYDGVGDKISSYAEMEAKQKIDCLNKAQEAEFMRR